MDRRTLGDHESKTCSVLGDDIVQPWQVMPEQVGSAGAPACTDGIRRLLVAILDDALRVLFSPPGMTSIGRPDRRRARQWFDSTDRSHAFTFERICEVLDLPASEFRSRVRRNLSLP